MHKTTLYLDEETRRGLKALAREGGRSEAALIREAIARLTGGSEQPLPRALGVARGPGDLSTRTDELLAGFGRAPTKARGSRRGRRR